MPAEAGGGRAAAAIPAHDASLPSDPPAALSIEAVSYRYGRGAPVLDDVSFTVPQGSFTALLGPNGAGKTTIFGLVTGLLANREGRVAIRGLEARQGPQALAALGLVFQQPTLDLDLTVRQNLHYFASLHGLSRAEATARIAEELDRLGMADRASERVRDLNGGHRRRTEIARALLHRPALLLLDEPTVGLDVASRAQIVRHVHRLAHEFGIGILWTTHLIDEIAPEDDLVVLVRGRVVEQGRTAEVIARTGVADLGDAFARLSGRPGT